MFLNKFREKIYVNKHIKIKLEILETELAKIRQHSDLLAICPKPTDTNWLGVNLATKGLFKESVFEIPQYFSNSVYNEVELALLSKKINDLNFKTVIFSGFADYFSKIIEKMQNRRIGIIFHGALSELTDNKNQLSKVFELYKTVKINKIGFIKKGLKECFEKLFGFKCFDLILKTSIPDIIRPKIENNTVNIGVFGNASFNKNIHNQVTAGLLLNNSKIYMINEIDFSYLGNENRILRHNKMDRDNFFNLLGSMSINLHISFSESWGQIVTESLALEVPCLTSNNNGIFDYDDYLKKILVIEEYDNPISIANHIKIVINNTETIKYQGLEYIKKLNSIAEEKLKDFLNA
ncbi:MAG: glycosyltransferase [Bacteroidia bacterium]|nr:glycosyltransferase [Bacteroidia bacterium]